MSFVDYLRQMKKTQAIELVSAVISLSLTVSPNLLRLWLFELERDSGCRVLVFTGVDVIGRSKQYSADGPCRRHETMSPWIVQH
jgi:hypothetical protein